MKKDQFITLLDGLGCEDHKASWKKDRLVSYAHENVFYELPEHAE